MSERPSCQNCRAFSALTNECRRHAPVPLPMPSVKAGEIRIGGMFPGVNASHWCLEFEPDSDVKVEFTRPGIKAA